MKFNLTLWIRLTPVIMLALLEPLLAQVPRNGLKNFSRLTLGGSTNVVLIPSETFGYSIEEESKSNEVKVTQNGEEVKITDQGDEDGFKRSEQNRALVLLFSPCLSKIQIRGAGNLSSKGSFSNCSPEIILSGAGNLKLDGNFGNISLTISGAGDVELLGSCQSLDALVSGAGDLYSGKMISQVAKISVSGAGNAEVNASKTLDANVSGVGSILFSGDPQERRVRITGIGSVRQTDGKNEAEAVRGDSLKGRDKEDTTSIIIGDTHIIIVDGDEKKKQKIEIETPWDKDDEKNETSTRHKSKVKHIWSGFELGINGYYHQAFKSFSIPQKEFELDYTRSININLNPYEYHLRLIHNYLTLGTGFGFTFNRFMFDNSITLTTGNGFVDTLMSGFDYRKNMLKVSYLTIPLFLQMCSHSKPRKSFHIAAGVIGGLRLGSRTKQVWDNDGRQKRVVKDSYNLNPFRYSLMLRLGYRWLNIYADYALSSLFRAGKGPELYPFSAGITLIPFSDR